ncbi:uncharacterized protein [Rutidosis leptorrhynchoides]|uniref:uncharacterized protein n=1 Tax=Rutidosis leptorrhynchoides TaxID=125765 RepID=UPI003A9A02BA
MRCMGFGCKWRKWILSCLSSASIPILVNGSPTKEFSLSRGVRQEDLLSPFLFILAAEGLNISKAAIEKGLFKGVEIDDRISLGKWSRENAYSLRNILKCFELASGLKVNFQKKFPLWDRGTAIENMNVAFKNSFAKIIGDGSNTLFWGKRLDNSRTCLVQDRVEVSKAETIFKWDWARNLAGRTEGELHELSSLLAGFEFRVKEQDK